MIFITGATCLTGIKLLEIFMKNLVEEEIVCLVRKDSKNYDRIKNLNISTVFGDLNDEVLIEEYIRKARIIIHIAGIMYSNVLIKICNRVNNERIILIHTTGMFSKYRLYAAKYLEIEDDIKKTNLNITILRPTMIYGSELDHNMHKLILFIHSHKIFPVFGMGNNLMQPIYANDLAIAIYKCIWNDNTNKKEYNLAGKTKIKYKDLLKLISKKINGNIRFIYIPIPISICLIALYRLLMKLFYRKAEISIEQVKRMNEDKVFSINDAVVDFEFNPIDLNEGIENEIKGMKL